jgi:beta-lactamase regulating signal transducer with metallopeptidase domain
MNSGLWIIVIIPAIIAFIFAIFVTVNMVIDISARSHALKSKIVGHVVRLKVLPGNS